MTRKFKVINDNNFPSDKEIEEITERVSAPNYPYVNYILLDNASSMEKFKYDLCQNIIKYYQENNLSEIELTKILGVDEEKLIDILFSKIYNLNLEELIKYADNLFSPLEIGIIRAEPRREIIRNNKK